MTLKENRIRTIRFQIDLGKKNWLPDYNKHTLCAYYFPLYHQHKCDPISYCILVSVHCAAQRSTFSFCEKYLYLNI